MVQIIGQEGLGELLGGAVGSGFSQGVQDLTQHHLKSMLAGKQEEIKQKAAKDKIAADDLASFSPSNVKKEAIRLNYPTDLLKLADSEDISTEAQRNFLMGKSKDQSWFDAFKSKRDGTLEGQTTKQILENARDNQDQPQQLDGQPQQLDGQPQQEQPEEWIKPPKPGEKRFKEPGILTGSGKGHQDLYDDYEELKEKGEDILSLLKKGTQGSIVNRARAVLKGEGYKDFEERTGFKGGDKWWSEWMYSIGSMTENLPIGLFGLAGGTFLGGPVGGAAGFTALPTLVESSLIEYQKKMDELGPDGQMTFGDWLDIGDEVSVKTRDSALLGIILGQLSKWKLPGTDKLLAIEGGPAAQKIIDLTVKSGVLTGVEAAGRREFPTKNDFLQGFLTYGTYEALFSSIPGGEKGQERVYKQFKEVNLPPEEAASRMEKVAKEKNYDLNKPAEFHKTVREVTKEYKTEQATKESKVALKALEATEQPSAETQPAELARRISKRPAKEYITKAEEAKAKREKPLTERETAKRETAGEQAKVIETDIVKQEKDLAHLKERQSEKLKPVVEESLNNRIKATEKKISNLKEELNRHRGIERTGREPVTKAKLDEQIGKRLTELMDASTEPGSKAAEKLDKFFKQNSKDLAKALELNRRQKIPDSQVNDTYTKVHDAYIKGYERLLKDSKKLLDSPFYKGPRGEGIKRLIKNLEKNIKISKAKLKNHKDKWNTLNQLKGPKGALVKQSLKKLRTDIESLQKDFVKQIKIKDHIQSKVESAKDRTILQKKPDIAKVKLEAKKAAENINKASEKAKAKESTKKESTKKEDAFGETATDENIKKTAEKAGVNKNDLKSTFKKVWMEIPNILLDAFRNPKNARSAIGKLYAKMNIPMQLAVGTLVDTVLKEAKAPYLLRQFFLPVTAVYKMAIHAGSRYISGYIEDYKIDYYVYQLTKKREVSFKEAADYLDELTKKLKPKQRKEVMSRYRESTGF